MFILLRLRYSKRKKKCFYMNMKCMLVCVLALTLLQCLFVKPPPHLVQTASVLEGSLTDLWVLSASSSLSIKAVIESCEFVSFTQIYWNDIHSLPAPGTNSRLYFRIRALYSMISQLQRNYWEMLQSQMFRLKSVMWRRNAMVIFMNYGKS